MAQKQKGLGEPKPPTGEWGACHSCDWDSLTDPPSYGGLALHLSQGYPEGGGNITAAETSTMTFKEQLWLSQAGEQISAPSSKQRQESQQGTDRFIMYLGAAPLHFAGDKVTPCSQSREVGWDGYSK